MFFLNYQSFKIYLFDEKFAQLGGRGGAYE
ncbi:hypothetical protein [Streptococcus sp. X13SY08]|nr:hypothetical protein [Streptococcus sp. X13SY08]